MINCCSSAPKATLVKRLLDSMNQTSLLLTICFMVLHKLLVKDIGFPGLGIGMMVVSFHDSGSLLFFQMSFNGYSKDFGGSCLRNS